MATAGMNAESFSTYLAQPAKLYQLPYQEIKNLVAEYPYSANLRRLLLLKSKIEQDPKFEQYLHDLASSTLDRKHLYEFVTSEIPQLLDLETEPEDRLELQDLTEMREKDKILVTTEQEEEVPPLLATSPPPSNSEHELLESTVEELEIAEEDLFSLSDNIPEEAPASAIVFEFEPPAREEIAEEQEENQALAKAQEDVSAPESVPTPEPDADVEPQEAINELTMVVPIIEAVEEPGYRVPTHLVDNLIAGSLLQLDQYQPQPTSHFQSWQVRHQGLNRDWKSLRRGTTLSNPKQKTKEVAKQSVQDPTNLASETLAKLLARQGQYRKAVKIYQRLSLLYPEKSRYFAATIEELKQKI
ncbi:MAG: hypothetical protein AAFZ63_16690 [Bacteroidota bacterium]